jgi:hypothetical protein
MFHCCTILRCIAKIRSHVFCFTLICYWLCKLADWFWNQKNCHRFSLYANSIKCFVPKRCLVFLVIQKRVCVVLLLRIANKIRISEMHSICWLTQKHHYIATKTSNPTSGVFLFGAPGDSNRRQMVFLSLVAWRDAGGRLVGEGVWKNIQEGWIVGGEWNFLLLLVGLWLWCLI